MVENTKQPSAKALDEAARALHRASEHESVGNPCQICSYFVGTAVRAAYRVDFPDPLVPVSEVVKAIEQEGFGERGEEGSAAHLIQSRFGMEKR